MTNHRRDKHINAIRAYLGVGEDKWGIGVRKHSDGTICKARSRETCPKEHHIEQADRLDETQKVQRLAEKRKNRTSKPYLQKSLSMLSPPQRRVCLPICVGE